MSGRIVGEVLDYAPDDLPRLDFDVLIALAEDAFEKDRTARRRCSDTEIAHRVRSTPSSVRNALSRLKARGLIRPVFGRVYRGQQQNWVVAQLSSYHREAGRIRPSNAPPPSDAFDPPESVTT